MMLLIGLLILIIIISIVLSSIKLNKENLYDDNSDCAKTYAQCGGKNWSGQTNCCPGNICKPQNDYYSQCLPGSGPPPPGPSPNCSPAYGQCGGKTWSGPTCCVSGNTCIKQGQYYSQCKPSPPPPHPSPPPPHPSPPPPHPSPPPPHPSPPSPPGPRPNWLPPLDYNGKYWTCSKTDKEKYNTCVTTTEPTKYGPINIKNLKDVYNKFKNCQDDCKLKELPLDNYQYYMYDKESNMCVPTDSKTPFLYKKNLDPNTKKDMYCGQPITGNDKTVVSSTTNFGFGADTACVCNGSKLAERLAKLGWVGTATPDWMLTPFLQKGNAANATGDATPEESYGKPYYSNCASGKGGCGKCWKLEVISKNPIGGSDKDLKKENIGKPVYAVGIDSCEDRNAYGNNYQWCVAAGQNQETPYNTKGWSGNWPKGSPSGMSIIQGKFNIDNPKYADWTASCQEDNSCKNLAGFKGHFDIGIQQLSPELQELAIPWLKENQDLSGYNYNWNNLIVRATPIECPDAVKDSFKSSCGGNSTLDQSKCFYCPSKNVQNGQPGSLPYSSDSTIPGSVPEWWGGCTHNQSIPLNNTTGSCSNDSDCQFSSEKNMLGFDITGAICNKGTDGVGRCEMPVSPQKPWTPSSIYNCPRTGAVTSHGQCGGETWEGIGCSTQCPGKQTCQVRNKYYSGCVGEEPKACDRVNLQCGGLNWTGTTDCGGDSCECVKQNDYYSQCNKK